MSTISEVVNGKFAHSVSLRYTLPNGHKSSIKCSLGNLRMVTNHLLRDGMNCIKILHYYDKNGMMIKEG